LGQEPAAGKQVEQVLKVGEGKSIPYLLWLPKDYETKAGKFPLMLFLHGRGESQGPLSSVKKWGPPRRLEHGEALPYVVASPQCPPADSWNRAGQQALLLALIDHLIKELKVDPERIYLTGLSMGGYGSWRLAADHPELFAAVAPVCGGGKTEDANKLKDLPIWVWHGADDSIVLLREST
jgi:predicted peptidase